jgi:predicted phosphodiesterase
MGNYIIMSDLHLGEEECSFVEKNHAKKLAEELKSIGNIDEIILLGDIMDLALSPIQDVTDQFKKFLSAIADISKKIVYIPGNHDHHIWTLHIERNYIERMSEGEIFYRPAYTDIEFAGKLSFISGYLLDGYKDKLIVKYPTHEINLKVGGKTKRCLLHHGHQIYGIGVRLLSLEEALKDIKESLVRMEELELQNIGVYELFWFYLELSSRLRDQIEKNWENYGAFGAFSVILREMVDSSLLSGALGFGNIAIDSLRKPKDRGGTIDQALTAIIQYLDVRNGSSKSVDCLIYGHSHVPQIKKRSDIKGKGDFPQIIANSGSWLREKGKPDRISDTYILLNENEVKLRLLGNTDLDTARWN